MDYLKFAAGNARAQFRPETSLAFDRAIQAIAERVHYEKVALVDAVVPHRLAILEGQQWDGLTDHMLFKLLVSAHLLGGEPDYKASLDALLTDLARDLAKECVSERIAELRARDRDEREEERLAALIDSGRYRSSAEIAAHEAGVSLHGEL